MENKPEALRQVNLFATLSQDALQCIDRVAVQRAYVLGETILLEGGTCRAACSVFTGQVRVYRNAPSGREQVLMQLGAGQDFSLVPMLHADTLNHASVQAITCTYVIV